MANSGVREVEWARSKNTGKPKVKRVTEPEQGVGTGTSVLLFDSEQAQGVKVASVATPQKPKVPAYEPVVSKVEPKPEPEAIVEPDPESQTQEDESQIENLSI